jgi:hypothetical protein
LSFLPITKHFTIFLIIKSLAQFLFPASFWGSAKITQGLPFYGTFSEVTTKSPCRILISSYIGTKQSSESE